MNALIQLLTSQSTLVFLSAVLAGMTLLTAVWWARIVGRATRGLNMARGAVAEAGEMAPAKIGEQIGGILRPFPAWGAAWDQFDAQCTTLAEGMLVAKQAPDTYFYVGAWQREHAMYWFRGLPGTLVGLGLCFTFAGIIAVIYVAATALDANSDAAAQTEALRQLLGGASLKFGTSLAGVFCSIAYALFFRRSLGKLDAAIDAFNAALTQRITVLEPAALLQRNLEEAQRHTSSLATLGEGIANRVGDKLAEANLVFGEAAARLEKGVEAMSQRMVEATQTEMERFVTAATAGLDTALRNHLQAISTSLDAIRERLDETRRGFEAITAQAAAVRGDYQALGNEIQTRSVAIGEVLLGAQAKVEGHLQGAAAAAAGVREAFTGIAGDVETVRALPAAFAEIAASVRDSVSQWQTLATKFGDAADTTATAAAQTRASMLVLGVQWKEQADRLAELSTLFSTTSRATQGQFDTHAFQFAEAAGDLRRAAEAATTALEPFHQIGPLAESLTAAAAALENAVQRKPTPRNLAGAATK